jgi:hypothetical protein
MADYIKNKFSILVLPDGPAPRDGSSCKYLFNY